MNSLTRPPYTTIDKSRQDPFELNTIVLKCGNSGSAIIPQGTNITTVFPIISINTTCIKTSCIKLNFTSNIVSINLVGTLTFQLFRLCNNELQANTIGPQWTFTRTAGTTDISTFSFFVCDCDLCPSKECKYAVVVNPANGNTGNVLITNATLSAVAESNCNSALGGNPLKHALEHNQSILKCGTPIATTLTGTANGSTTTTTIASIYLNSASPRNPCVRLEFTGNIIIPTAIPNATLTFQVFKNCKNNFLPIPVGPQWTYLTPLAISDTFSFFVCDCNTCFDECCTYFVQVTSALTVDDAGVLARVIINDATLSALAVENAEESCFHKKSSPCSIH